MPGCDARPADLLDHLYGLLEADEAAALEAHVATCPACAAALLDARKSQALFAAAAKSTFPSVTFAAPAEFPTEPADARGSVRRTLAGWAVAAGLLLTFCGLAVPTGYDLADFTYHRPDVVRNAREVAYARDQYKSAEVTLAAAKQAADIRLAEAEKAHDQLVSAWIADEKAAATAAAARPFVIDVRGPASAVPGAPNEYAVTVKDKAGQFEQKLDPTASATVRLPAKIWEKLPAGGEAFLQVSAQDEGTGLTAQLREPVRLLGPVFATFLTTDKPLYRPGETVYFRSTTLDRTRLLPPEQEVGLRFELTGPDGKEVAALNGQARVAVPVPGNGSADVVGPDGRPVRGVGCGGFDLKADVPGGTYTLSVFEVHPGHTRQLDTAKPLARRVVQVAGYRPDRLEKKLEFDGSSFGPGEPVQAKLTVTDQGRPVAGATLSVAAKADDKTLPVVGAVVTAADGTAAVRFTLPKDTEPAQATLSVAVNKDGLTETVVRPVPLASRKLALEFFPEGGDLVAGLPNRVYLRATIGTGRPADVVGVLTDGERDLVPVRTLRDADRPGANRGLAVFTFTPEPGKKYAVRLSQPTAIDAPPGGFALPAAKAGGVVLTARDAATKPGEPIRLTLGFAGPRPTTVLVGAYTRGRAIAHASAKLTPGQTTDVALDPGPTPLGGVTRITVFEDVEGGGRTDLVPLAERLVFRRPKEVLNLTASVGKPSFVPGEPVTLDVTARTESGAPTPAVLWAAVVSRSVLSMADDKTERLLPTHFRLGGEVQHPDELEHADFLLTEPPHAAESLDLVLGTQGWRRFAEQAPDQFRARTPAAEADRFLASLGATGPQFTRSEVQAVADRYWPKYEAAALAVDRADAGRKSDGTPEGEAAQQARRAYESRLAVLGNAVDQIDSADARMTARRWWLIVTLPALALATLGTLLARRRVEPGQRTWLTLGAIGFVVVALIVLAGSLLTADLGAAWRQEAASAPRVTRDRWGNVVAPTAALVVATPATPQNGNVPFAEAAPAAGKAEPPPAPAGVMRGGVAPKPVATPVVDDGRPTAPKPAVLPRPTPPAFGHADRRVQERLQESLNAWDDPADREAVKAVRANVPAGRPFLVRQYAHTQTPAADGARTDFAETLLWQPVLVLPDDGKATLRFSLSDAVTGYRVLVAGHTLDGRVGAVTETITVRPPLSVEPKLPHELGAGDVLTVPLAVTNGTAEPVVARPKVSAAGLTVETPPAETVEVPANAGGRTTLRLVPAATGTASVTASVTAGDATDSVRRTLQVVPDGFPVEGAKSERLAGKMSATVTLPGDRVAGGTRVGVTLYPNALAGVLGGLDGLLREPNGCFEQSSSANYPNVMALDYLRATNAVAPDAAGRSRALLDGGYRKLTGYECPDTPSSGRKGFEWFGKADQPHPGLSAYGLLQFTDMARVYPVDPAVLARTKGYLLSLRDGDGGFKQSKATLDQFGRAPEHVTDAYIVWAISETECGGEQSDLAKELDRLLERAAGESAGDPYFVALVGNAALNRGRTADGLRLLDAVAASQSRDGSVPGATAGITGSGVPDLVTETTALAILGWLKADKPDRFLAPVGKGVGYLIGRRQSGGAFGATQATVLALKALTEHARRNAAEPEAGELRLLVNGKLVAKRPVRTDAAEPIVVDVPDADELFPPGVAVEVTAETTLRQAVPASLTWAARTRQPATAANPPVTLAAGLDLSVLGEGETTRLTATVTNTVDATTGMAVAILGLPTGLTVPADGKQLRRLTADGAIDFWEVRGRELVLYWRGLTPRQVRIVSVELVAEFPGQFKAPASRAYLYYDADRKHWVRPLAAVVKPAP